MSKIEESLALLLGEGLKAIKMDLKELVQETKSDSSQFIRSQGQSLERYINAFAQREISRKEFEDLVLGLTSLEKIECRRLSVKAKVRAQETANRIASLAVEGLLKAI